METGTAMSRRAYARDFAREIVGHTKDAPHLIHPRYSASFEPWLGTRIVDVIPAARSRGPRGERQCKSGQDGVATGF